MSAMHFQPPKKDAVKNKFITSLSMILIVLSLYFTCYYLFFRTVEVDVTKDAAIAYRGETGSASVEVKNRNQNYNQRIQEFMDSITYEVTPKNKLSNGDILTVTAHYDEQLAKRYNIDPINTIRSVIVDDLPQRFAKVEDIPQSYLRKMEKRGKQYLEKNMNQILNEDFTEFSIHSDPKLVKQTLIHRVFLDGKKAGNKDKVVDIYSIVATGKVNTSSEKETLVEKQAEIYYMITYNEVNTSLKILDENVYGEKLMTQKRVDMDKESDFLKLMNAKYQSGYQVNILK